MGVEADLESKRMPALARVVMFCQSTRKHMSAKHRLQVLTMLCEFTVISRRIEGINRHFLLAFWLHTNMLISTRLYTHAHRCTHPFCHIHANKNNTWNLRQCSCYELCTCTPHSFTQITPQHCAPLWFNRKAYFFLSSHWQEYEYVTPLPLKPAPHLVVRISLVNLSADCLHQGFSSLCWSTEYPCTLCMSTSSNTPDYTHQLIRDCKTWSGCVRFRETYKTCSAGVLHGDVWKPLAYTTLKQILTSN